MIIDPGWRKQIILENFLPAIDEYENPTYVALKRRCLTGALSACVLVADKFGHKSYRT